MALLSRKRALLSKLEATYGTDPVPTGAANAILVRNMNLIPIQTEFVPRELIKPYLGNYEHLPDETWAALEFEVEIAGGGAAGTAPKWGPLVQACAFSETISPGVSVTYAPQSDDSIFKGVTHYFYLDGVLHEMNAARGSFSAEMKVKGIPVFKFRFIGVYVPVIDAALPTVVYSGFQTPLVVGNTNTTPFSIHSFSGVASEYTLDIQNEVVPRALIGGSKSVEITNRQARGSILVQAETIASKDFFAAVRAATIGNLTMTHGTVAGNKVQLTSSRVQLIEPAYEDLEGVQMLRLTPLFIPTDAGNDELSIVVT